MECGECTLCCKLLETHDIKTERGEICPYCSEKGCLIYHDRPNECREYKCMWLQMDAVGIEMRPDKSHIIFDKISDTTICAIHDPDYEISKFVIGQIASFNKEGYSVVIFYGKKHSVFRLPEHDYTTIMREIDDRSKLYRRFN
jgi:hypothetical protein